MRIRHLIVLCVLFSNAKSQTELPVKCPLITSEPKWRDFLTGCKQVRNCSNVDGAFGSNNFTPREKLFSNKGQLQGIFNITDDFDKDLIMKVAQFSDFTYDDRFDTRGMHKRTTQCGEGEYKTLRMYSSESLLEKFSNDYVHAKWLNLTEITPFDCWSEDKNTYNSNGLFGTMNVNGEQVCLLSFRGSKTKVDWANNLDLYGLSDPVVNKLYPMMKSYNSLLHHSLTKTGLIDKAADYIENGLKQDLIDRGVSEEDQIEIVKKVKVNVMLDMASESLKKSSGLFANEKRFDLDAMVRSVNDLESKTGIKTGILKDGENGYYPPYYQRFLLSRRYTQKKIHDSKCKHVVVLGHSMGGAIATIAAIELKNALRKYNSTAVNSVNLVTFAGARSISWKGGKKEDGKNLDFLFNIVREGDVVPSIPFTIMGYTDIAHSSKIDTEYNNEKGKWEYQMIEESLFDNFMNPSEHLTRIKNNDFLMHGMRANYLKKLITIFYEQDARSDMQ